MADNHVIEALFPELAAFNDRDFSRIGSDRPTLMIAMTARTGSSHLCSALASVLPIAMPIELFNARDNLVWESKRRNVTTFADLLVDYFEESKDVLVFKTSWQDFVYFKERVWCMFPNLKIMYLNRIDTEAQAVSLYKAEMTGDWHDSPIITRPPKLSDEELNKRFDLTQVCKTIFGLERQKLFWEDYFFSKRLQPLRLNYENFQSGIGPSAAMVAEFIGYSGVDPSTVRSTFQALSDNVNKDWLRKVRNFRTGKFFQWREVLPALSKRRTSSIPSSLLKRSKSPRFVRLLKQINVGTASPSRQRAPAQNHPRVITRVLRSADRRPQGDPRDVSTRPESQGFQPSNPFSKRTTTGKAALRRGNNFITFNYLPRLAQFPGPQDEVRCLLDKFERALARNPEGLLLIAQEHKLRGNIDDHRRIKAAALVQGDDARAVWALSVELEKAGKLEEALALLSGFCTRNGDPLTFRRLIMLMHREKRFEEAERLLETRLAASPDNPLVLGLLAVVYAANNRRMEALEMGRKAVAAGSDQAGLHDLLRRLSR